MELNYRPALPPAGMLLFAAASSIGTLLIAVTVLFWILQLLGPFVGYLFNGTAMMGVLLVLLWYLKSHPVLPELTWQGLWRYGTLFSAVIGLVVVAVLTTTSGAYFLVFVPAVAVTVLFSYCCAKQFAFWAAVNPAVDWREVRFWQSLWP